jgi:hypothetical protein
MSHRDTIDARVPTQSDGQPAEGGEARSHSRRLPTNSPMLLSLTGAYPTPPKEQRGYSVRTTSAQTIMGTRSFHRIHAANLRNPYLRPPYPASPLWWTCRLTADFSRTWVAGATGLNPTAFSTYAAATKWTKLDGTSKTLTAREMMIALNYRGYGISIDDLSPFRTLAGYDADIGDPTNLKTTPATLSISNAYISASEGPNFTASWSSGGTTAGLTCYLSFSRIPFSPVPGGGLLIAASGAVELGTTNQLRWTWQSPYPTLTAGLTTSLTIAGFDTSKTTWLVPVTLRNVPIRT